MIAVALLVTAGGFLVFPLLQGAALLVGSARHLVYDAPPRRQSVRSFYSRTYWRRIAERPLFLLIAAVLTFAPAALAGEWSLRDPGAAAGLVRRERAGCIMSASSARGRTGTVPRAYRRGSGRRGVVTSYTPWSTAPG